MATNNSINLSQSGLTAYDGAGTFFGRTLQAGTNVSISNPDGIAGNPSISVTGIMTWVEVTGTSQAIVVNTGYVANNASLVTLTLPSSAAIGDSIVVMGKGSGGWKIAQNASQQIIFGKVSTTIGTGGFLSSTDKSDCITIRCITAGTGTIWEVDRGPQGNINYA